MHVYSINKKDDKASSLINDSCLKPAADTTTYFTSFPVEEFPFGFVDQTIISHIHRTAGFAVVRSSNPLGAVPQEGKYPC